MATKSQKKSLQRRGAVYIAVMGTAILVSLIGFTALHLSRLELRKATTLSKQAYARQLAQSGVEMALARITLHPNNEWRSEHSHDVEVVITPEGMSETIRFRFLDYDPNGPNDGNLNDDPTDWVEIQGIGKVIDRTETNNGVLNRDTSTFVYRVIYSPGLKLGDYIGPQILSSYDVSGGNASTQEVKDNVWYGQYFVPDLPSGATEWSVTRVEVNAKQPNGPTAKLFIKLYEADGGGLPVAELETNSLKRADLAAVSKWVGVNFANVTSRPAGTGLCLCLEGTQATESVVIQYEGGGVTQTNSHLLTASSSGNWTIDGTDKSLWYRIHGVYTTAAGETKDFTVSPGTWKVIPSH